MEHHEAISPDALDRLRPERRANHLLDVARGYAQWGKPDQAAEFLVAADALCPPPRSAADRSPSPCCAS